LAKILVIGKYYPPFEGGTEVYTRDVCSMLSQKHHVSVVVYNHEAGRKEETIDGVSIVRCSVVSVIKGQPIAPSLIWDIRLNDFDLVHFHAPNFFANAVLLIKLYLHKKKIPVVITHHMEVFGRKYLRRMVIPLYRLLVRRAATVIVTSAKNANLSIDLPSNASIVAVPLGIDVCKHVLTEWEIKHAQEWRTKLAGSAKIVAFIGRHARYKGLDVLIKAIAKLEGVHAMIAGDGPYRSTATKLAADLGVSDRVHFLGYLSKTEKIQLLYTANVFALPSTETTEAFGISQLEAMTMGIPVVSSDLPTGVTDVAIDQVTALVSPPGDPDALADRINRLLTDLHFAKQLSSRARAHVESNFALPIVLERTAEIFEQLLPRADRSYVDNRTNVKCLQR
jgi:glycosyltransferase involved in cell wall biosynthesis